MSFEEDEAARRAGMLQHALNVYDKGLPQGDTTGWYGVDQLFRVGMDQWTLITGIPHSGKSEWLDALMVNLLELGPDWGFVLYSPENFPTYTHLIKLAEKVVRKPFQPGPTPRMTKAEFADACDFLKPRVRWIDPHYKTLGDLIAAATYRPHRHEKLGIVLDPWNAIESMKEPGESDADYLARALGLAIRAVREFGCHLFIVAHPKVIARDRDGSRPVPSPYDVSGGAHWYNRADNIITVHRQQTDPPTAEVEIHVQKVRRKWLGHIGLATLTYDKVTGRYFEF